MSQNNNNDLIAAYVDGEISDPSELNELKELVENDTDLKFDYQVQFIIKSLVTDKLRMEPAPERIRKKIIRKINPSGKLNMISKRPLIAYGTLLIIFLAIFLIIFNRPPQISVEDLSFEQTGEDNFYIQAKENFISIIEGSQIPQILSDNPEEIKSFFKNQGVRYNTLVPVYEKWDLLGAMISEEKEFKLAHHVYISTESKIIYFFQVDEEYIRVHKILKLSDHLNKYLNDGNCFNTYEAGISTLMTKAGKNIIAVVSNIPLTDLTENFCSLAQKDL